MGEIYERKLFFLLKNPSSDIFKCYGIWWVMLLSARPCMHSRCKCIKGTHQASARILKLLVQMGNHGFMGVLFFKRFLYLGLSHFKKVMGG